MTIDRQMLGLLVLAFFTFGILGCSSPGPSDNPLPTVPAPPPAITTNTFAVIMDISSQRFNQLGGVARPKFELHIDGVLVGGFDLRQSNRNCEGFGNICLLGGSINNIEPGRHDIRVTLVAQNGAESVWTVSGTAKLTLLDPIRETLYDLREKKDLLNPGDRLAWTISNVDF